MKKLEAGELEQALRDAPGWDLAGGKLQREWAFPDFVAAMKFVNQVAEIAAEAIQLPHHERVALAQRLETAGEAWPSSFDPDAVSL